ncbi:MAG TPA: hypothetical protein VHV74_26335 [Pseudonocardiaceae bacterium]|jgi:hypothetical protein|nr:hypothetical protein [Pseudonocardiaceae bacterium]
MLGAAVLLTGCAVAEAGAARPDPAALGNVPVLAGQAFGDASTVDPCSVLDPDTLKAADASASIAAADSLDDCRVHLVQEDGTKTTVTVGPLEGPRDLPDDGGLAYRTESVGGGIAVRIPTDGPPGTCAAYLTFRDGYRLPVGSHASNLDSETDVCPSAKAVGEVAGAQIRAGGVRHFTYPRDSVGGIDPCRLVEAGNLTRAGLPGATPTEFPQRHECGWTNGRASVELAFQVGPEPVTKAVGRSTVATVAGRSTLVSQVRLGTERRCSAETGLNPYTYGSVTDQGLVETALVTVHRPDGATFDPCAVARELAVAAWPQLPAVTG